MLVEDQVSPTSMVLRRSSFVCRRLNMSRTCPTQRQSTLEMTLEMTLKITKLNYHQQPFEQRWTFIAKIPTAVLLISQVDAGFAEFSEPFEPEFYDEMFIVMICCYIALHCTILHYIALYCAILNYIALYWTILHYCTLSYTCFISWLNVIIYLFFLSFIVTVWDWQAALKVTYLRT